MCIKEMTIQEIQEQLGYKIKIIENKPQRQLVEVSVGNTFKIGGFEFIVLEQLNGQTAVILKDFWKKTKFDGDSNNYSSSNIRKILNSEFYNLITEFVGVDNIIQHKVDLTSEDGRKDYGTCNDYVSLLTCDLYRKYVDILDKYSPKGAWWLATAYSTLHNYDSYVRLVNFDGALGFSRCYCDYGVCPFCILNSSISVS